MMNEVWLKIRMIDNVYDDLANDNPYSFQIKEKLQEHCSVKSVVEKLAQDE